MENKKMLAMALDIKKKALLTERAKNNYAIAQADFSNAILDYQDAGGTLVGQDGKIDIGREIARLEASIAPGQQGAKANGSH